MARGAKGIESGCLVFGSVPAIDRAVHSEYMDCFRGIRNLFDPQYASNDAAVVYTTILSQLEAIAQLYDAECAFIVEVDLEVNLVSNTFEWHRGKQRSTLVHAEVVELEDHPLLKSLFTRGEAIIYDVEALRDDWPLDYARMHSAGVNRAHAVALPGSSGIVGALIVEEPNRFCGMTSFLHLGALSMCSLVNNIRELRKKDSQRMDFARFDVRDVRFNMLGSFQIETSRGCLAYGDGLSEQTCKLLVCLLRNRDSVYSIEDLFEMLWPQRLADNPYEAVKNIVSRARKQLSDIINLPIIVAKRGTFFINPELNSILDTELFLEECSTVFDKMNHQDLRIKSCERAIGFYRGDMFSGIEITEHWLMTRRTRYRLTYLSMIEEYLRLLAGQGRLDDMAEVISASKGFSFTNPDIQWLLVETLISNGRRDLARNHYLISEELFSEEQKRLFEAYLN